MVPAPDITNLLPTTVQQIQSSIITEGSARITPQYQPQETLLQKLHPSKMLLAVSWGTSFQLHRNSFTGLKSKYL